MSGIITASDDAAEKILSVLDAEDAKATPEATAPEAKPAPETASEVKAEEAPSTEDAVSDPEPKAPSVEAPSSWSAEDKQRFASLPPEVQSVIAQRERDRDVALRKGQDEVANARKAIEAERAQTQTERQRYAEQLERLVQQAHQFDPVLSEGAKTDWVKLSQEDPAGYVQKWAAFQHRQSQLTAIQAEQARVQGEYLKTRLAEENAKLMEALPEWKDEAKRIEAQKALSEYLVKTGFSKEEVAQALDHRAIVLANKARLYDQMMAEQAKIAAKKVAPVPPKPAAKTVASGDNSGKADDATLKRIRGMSNTRNQADAIARLLG